MAAEPVRWQRGRWRKCSLTMFFAGERVADENCLANLSLTKFRRRQCHAPQGARPSPGTCCLVLVCNSLEQLALLPVERGAGRQCVCPLSYPCLRNPRFRTCGFAVGKAEFTSGHQDTKTNANRPACSYWEAHVADLGPDANASTRKAHKDFDTCTSPERSAIWR